MTVPAPSKYEVLKTITGKYVWWPALGVVDFIPKGKRSGVYVDSLTFDHTEREAVVIAAKHVILALGKKK